MNTRIFLSSNPENLRAALSGFNRTATVEAEYGSDVVEGNVVTLAHHGERSGNPCPCIGENLDIEVDAIGVSHFDLDTLGGVLRVLGFRGGNRKFSMFWETAALVDLLGVHKLRTQVKDSAKAKASEVWGDMSRFEEQWNTTVLRLNAFWAWSETNRLFPPRDGSVLDCTEFFLAADEAVSAIMYSAEEGHAELMEAGRVWADAKAQLEESSYVTTKGGVIMRQSDSFVNHLYEHGGVQAMDAMALEISVATTITEMLPM